MLIYNHIKEVLVYLKITIVKLSNDYLIEKGKHLKLKGYKSNIFKTLLRAVHLTLTFLPSLKLLPIFTTAHDNSKFT